MKNKLLIYIAAVVASLSTSGLFLLIAIMSAITDDGGGSLWGKNSDIVLSAIKVLYLVYVVGATYIFNKKLGANIYGAFIIFALPAFFLLRLFW